MEYSVYNNGTAPSPDEPPSNGIASSPDQPPNKRRRKKSMVWDFFRTETVSEDCTRAYCKQCSKSFAYIKGSKLSGTSHLKRHITLGICPVNRGYQENGQRIPSTNGYHDVSVAAPPKKRYRDKGSPKSSTPFNWDLCSQELAKMIICHDYPLKMVEHRGFIEFTHTLQPQFDVASFSRIEDDCLGLFESEKPYIAYLLSGVPGRVSLSLDLWISDQTIGYAILTGHFVGADWILHRHILNVVMVPFPESEVAFNDAVVSCLSDWGLGSRLCTLTLDESFAGESVAGNLKGLLSINNPHLLDQKAKYLIGDCYARVLNRLAQEAIRAMKDIVDKVRRSVKYVKSSESCALEFNEIKVKLQVPSAKTLVLDDQRKWDSTYHMLSAASELKEVFDCLDSIDPNFREKPFIFEWKDIDMLCSYLKLLYDAAGILSGGTYPTANKFFTEVCKIQQELAHGARSPDPYLSNFVKPLHIKFDKYWEDYSEVLAMAVVMDPRYKSEVVKNYFSEICGNSSEATLKVRKVIDSIYERFIEYLAQTLPLPSIHVEQRQESFFKADTLQEEAFLSSSDVLSDFDVYISEISSNQPTKSEFDLYMEEPLLPRNDEDLDVLGWWKLHRIKYPNLSKVAADILSIPFAIVDSDSVFDLQSKRLDGYKCSLKPRVLEALICAKDWLQSDTIPVSEDWLQCVTVQDSSDFSAAIVRMEY